MRTHPVIQRSRPRVGALRAATREILAMRVLAIPVVSIGATVIQAVARVRVARGLRAATCVLCLGLIWCCVGVSGAEAQSVDTLRSVTLPAPERGVIYIRSGPPGAVRIRSRHSTSRNRARRPSLPSAERSVDEAPGAFAPADLSRLEALLARQGLNLDVGMARRGGEDVVVLRSRAGDAAQSVDTLSMDEAGRLLGSVGGGRTVREAAPADIPPLVTRIERSILDAGLFRSLQLNFEFDRSVPLATAEPTLDAVAKVMKRYPDLRIEVAGHTDSVGPEAYNRRLSSRRAERVRRELIERGVAAERVRTDGYGETRPVLSNRTPTGRALNRRVEFVLLNPEAAEHNEIRTRPIPDDQLERLRESIRTGIREGFDERDPQND